MKKVVVFMVAAALVAGAQAAIVAEYDYTATVGADPELQGWTLNQNLTNSYLGGFDAGDGWGVTDGTSTGYAWYGDDVAAGAMDGGFTATWSIKLHADAYKTDGTVGVADYFLPPNQGRQSDNALWVETPSYMFLLTATADENGNLAINDGTTTHVLTSGGGNNGYDTWYTLSVVCDGTNATLSYGGNDYALTDYGTFGGNRVIFGAFSGSGQGGVTYDAITVDGVVPEPATLAVLGLGGLLLRKRRV